MTRFHDENRLFDYWAAYLVDDNTHAQMDVAMGLPVTAYGALMPDGHLGYGLPIGGVLACRNAVIPYAVGVDIACRMKLSIYDASELSMMENREVFTESLHRRTFFGVGVKNNQSYDHPVLHEDWSISEPIKENLERASVQVGTSGSGNHFVEWGTVTVDDSFPGLVSSRVYIALMSHSGSRGPGAAVCNYFSKVAKAEHPEGGELAWLDMDSTAGQDYWESMQLMGRFASANHELIHESVAEYVGLKPVATIENHHNFAWKETHRGEELIVHRKGATPAGKGVLGIIPGSMGTSAYLVSGKGNEYSLRSASHGAGRLMSRKQAKQTFNYDEHIKLLRHRGVHVLSAGVDEVCGVYKDIREVMHRQTDLVDVIGQFEPRIVKMCGSNDRAED